MLRNQRNASPPTDYNAMPYKYPYGNVMGPVGAGSRTALSSASCSPENDYLIDRDQQRDKLFTGIENFVSQDLMATESMGPIYDRTQEHLGNTDRAIIRMRRLLIKTAQDLADGIEPPATTAIFRDVTYLQRREDPGPGRRLAHPRHACRPDGARDGSASHRSARGHRRRQLASLARFTKLYGRVIV